MIQFKRGETKSWLKLKKPLAAGQPGYDKNKNKLKIGDGEKSWAELPYATGLSSDEILSSETDAKIRRAAAILINPLAALLDSPAVITYGEEAPNEQTVGQLYLQHYETEPEADYVVEMGINNIWTYRKWHSGIAECWGTYKLTTSVTTITADAAIFSNDTTMSAIPYPIQFIDGLPQETASLRSPGWVVWLGTGKDPNNMTNSGTYSILSNQELLTPSEYYITLNVYGRWK